MAIWFILLFYIIIHNGMKSIKKFCTISLRRRCIRHIMLTGRTEDLAGFFLEWEMFETEFLD
jgi:hypothetical protein